MTSAASATSPVAYPQVKATADRLQAAADADARERTLADTRTTVLSEERERLAGALREKEHTTELLTMDKAYLGNQVKILSEQVGGNCRRLLRGRKCVFLWKSNGMGCDAGNKQSWGVKLFGKRRCGQIYKPVGA